MFEVEEESNQMNFELIFVEFFKYFSTFRIKQIANFESNQTNFEQIHLICYDFQFELIFKSNEFHPQFEAQHW